MSVTFKPVIRLITIGVLVLTIVLLIGACGGSNATESSPAASVTPAAGGMVMPSATATEPSPTVVPNAVQDTSPVPGQILLAVDRVRLYADASEQSIVLNQYASTTAFTLLAPSGEYTEYPVQREGIEWYRLRATDGLVGWLPVATLVASE